MDWSYTIRFSTHPNVDTILHVYVHIDDLFLESDSENDLSFEDQRQRNIAEVEQLKKDSGLVTKTMCIIDLCNYIFL